MTRHLLLIVALTCACAEPFDADPTVQVTTMDSASDVDDDADGLRTVDERDVWHTDPASPDSDGGGLPDGDEVGLGSDPLNPGDDAR